MKEDRRDTKKLSERYLKINVNQIIKWIRILAENKNEITVISLDT